jgi:hypothetical protein
MTTYLWTINQLDRLASDDFVVTVPAPYRTYIIMLWPVLMVILREVTTSALSDK